MGGGIAFFVGGVRMLDGIRSGQHSNEREWVGGLNKVVGRYVSLILFLSGCGTRIPCI